MTALIEDVETDGFSFIWTIQNFSHCVQKKGEALESPSFSLDANCRKELCLQLYPRGQITPDTIGYYLKSTNYFSKVTFALSICSVKGSFKKVEDKESDLQRSGPRGFPSFLRLQELFSNGADAYLDKDVLTVRCRILKVNGEMCAPGLSHARTTVGVERTTYIWSLDNFGDYQAETKKTLPILSKMPSFTMNAFMSSGSYEKKLQMEITQTNTDKKYFTTCTMLVLDADGNIAHSVRDEHWFEVMTGEQIWKLPFVSKSKLLNREKLFPNGKLSLRCEFAVSPGVEYSRVERTQYGIDGDLSSGGCNQAMDPDLAGTTWKDSMQRLYLEARFSDVTISTLNREFPVHKAILCSRSEVFGAMFERDMKENRTGVIEIEDMDEDTISRMLLFIYTDAVEDLEWEAALNLYFAADKYKIVVLKRKCSNFLRDNINSSNVCSLLELSDMHQDRELMSAAQDFVCGHVDEINAEEWDKFMRDKSDLASEIMRLMFVRNLKA